jgi:hypothetical protein
MPVASCICGFTELVDESLIDHLLLAFVPDDGRVPDGQAHEEAETGHCLCGLATAAPAALDAHFLCIFTPATSTGRDGHKHSPARD